MSTGGGAEFRFVFLDEQGDAPPSVRPGAASEALDATGRGGRGPLRVPRPDPIAPLTVGDSSAKQGPLQAVSDLASQIAAALNNVPVLGRAAAASEALIKPLLATQEALEALRVTVTQTSQRGPTSVTAPSTPRPVAPGASDRVTPPPVQRSPDLPTNLNAFGPPKPPPIQKPPVQAPPVVPRVPAAPPTVPVQAGAAAPAVVPAAGGGGGAAAGGALASGGALAAVAVVGAVVLAIGGAVAAFRALIARSNELKESLAGYSGVLAASKARAEAARVQQDVQRAQFLGSDLAGYNDATARIDRALTKIFDGLTKGGLESVVPLLEAIAKGIETLAEGQDLARRGARFGLDSLLKGPIVAVLNQIAEDSSRTADATEKAIDDVTISFLDEFSKLPPLTAADKATAGDVTREAVRFGAVGGPQLGMK